MSRFGYLLDEGPMNIDLKEVKNMMKANPKMFGAELVNMMMADPYLLFMPMGWSALGRGVVNSLRLKYSKAFTMTRQIPKLLKLAQQICSDKAQAESAEEQAKELRDGSDKPVIGIATKSPTTEEILAEAEKLNNFVSKSQ